MKTIVQAVINAVADEADVLLQDVSTAAEAKPLLMEWLADHHPDHREGEPAGLPLAVLDAIPEAQRLRLPMRPGNRSLNLSNTVAVVVFEGWRQSGFDGGA